MIKTITCVTMATSWALALILQPNVAIAQSPPPLEDYQKSVALIDFRVSKMVKEAIAAGISKEAIDEMELEGIFEEVKPTEIDRVFGAVCLPKDLEQVMAMVMNDGSPPKDGFPVEFFVRFKFQSTESLDRVESSFSRHSVKVKLGDGNDYLTPKPGPEHKMFFARRIDKTMFEIGTEAYLAQPKRNFFTVHLKEAFASAPKESFRLVIDLKTRRELLQQAAKMAKENLDPVSSAYLDLINNAKSLVVTSGMSSEYILSMIVEANNDYDAEELTEGIDGLLGIAKLGFASTNAQMAPLLTPEMEQPLKTITNILNSLAASQTGSTVKVLVKKPENFADEVIKLQRGLAAQKKQFSQLQESMKLKELPNE